MSLYELLLFNKNLHAEKCQNAAKKYLQKINVYHLSILVVINLSVSLHLCCSITSGNTNNAFSISTSGSEGKVACNTATLISNGATSYTLGLTYVFWYIHLKIVTYFLFGMYCIHICVRMAFYEFTYNTQTTHRCGKCDKYYTEYCLIMFVNGTKYKK